MSLFKNFAGVLLLAGIPVASAGGKVLKVDQHGPAGFTSLRAAAAVVKPGDTIEIAKGSGPYREALYIKESGTPEQPIIVEGNGEVITGFEPLTGFREEKGVWVCDLPVKFPCVLTYRGERLVLSAQTGQPIRYAKLNEERTRLELLPGVGTTDWEISKRDFVVRIYNAANQTYRNIRASGSMNDAFNLHGAGAGLIFENIEGFHNLDEGFSAHDEIHCEIKGGRFWGNDNGICNVGSSDMQAGEIDVFANLGWGIFLTKCSAVINRLRAWDNGLTQIHIGSGTRVTFVYATAYEPAWSTRPWESYMESKTSAFSAPVRINSTEVTGSPVVAPTHRSPPSTAAAFLTPQNQKQP